MIPGSKISISSSVLKWCLKMTNLMPATPSHIETWIIRALTNIPLKRSELLEHLGYIAQKEGFTISSDTLKVAIAHLQRKGNIVHVQHGWWALPGWNAAFKQRNHAT